MKIISGKSIDIKFLGFWSFLIWFIFLVSFIPNSILITRGIGYLVWLAIFVVFAIALAMYVKDLDHFRKLLYIYINSFTIISIAGIVQWLLTLMGFDVLINYYFRSGIPRLHGFSYEPSYFSTYLFIPWVFHFLLYFSNLSEVKQKVYNRYALAILTMVMFLSFSRMGILLIILIIAAKAFLILRAAAIKKTIFLFELRFISMAWTFFIISSLLALVNLKKFLSVFEGLPILSKYSHSATIRIDDFINTWNIFIDSPFIGYSLGGIAPAIAKYKGHIEITQELVKKTEGMCIFLEVLAASGIIGFLFFAVFFTKFIWSTKILKQLSVKKSSDSIYLWISVHRLLIIAWLFQLLLLCLNQNILRNYVWVHIAILNLSFFVIKDHLKKNECRSTI
ncbi:MAG: O-antigen ligase family protein [Bacteroidota bacterium]